MKILNELKQDGFGGTKPGGIYVLILDAREARTLVEIAAAAHKANKRRTSFRTWKQKLENCLECY